MFFKSFNTTRSRKIIKEITFSTKFRFDGLMVNIVKQLANWGFVYEGNPDWKLCVQCNDR